MTNLPIKIFLILLLTTAGIQRTTCQTSGNAPIDFNELSEQFLKRIQEGKDTGDIESTLANTSLEALEEALTTDREKLAFWVNIYNAYIQRILGEKPELYKDRREFFHKKQIPIAGEMVSFSKIEHGIIRKSQWELGLGYMRKWFPNRLERKLRVGQRDYRIHFALNCGAKSCPPVAIYTPERLNEQFDLATDTYLKQTTSYDAGKQEVGVTSLFKWFRGDFCGSSGIKEILREYGEIPKAVKVDLIYRNYDWALDLNNFTNL